MNVGGILNSISNNLPQNYGKPSMDNDYRGTTIQENQIEEAALTKKAEIPNPYEEQGVPNFIWQIFTKVSEKADMYAQKNVEHKLFSNTDENTDWLKQITIAQENLAKPISENQLNDLVTEKNLILVQFNQPPMSPSDEKEFRELIKTRQKSQATILDGMMVAIGTASYKPLEVAA